MHHCCSPFRDADRDLLRLLLTTSAARVQFRSDVDGSWSRPTSFLRDRLGRGFPSPVSSVDFLSRQRRRPVLVSGVHANFLTHVSAKAASESTAHTCKDCGVRFISRLKYIKDTSLATCIRQSMYTTFPRARRSCPQEACAWEIRSCCTPRNFRRHCIRHLESGETWA
jgi:hypothetical protein